MSLEQIEIVIDANGLARTEQVFKSVDKYLERIHRRVDKLGRLRVTPMARLTDRVTPQLEKINRALNRLTGQVRRVTIVPVFKFESLAEISAQLEATLKAALELKAALDFRAAMNLKASLDVKAALQAVASLKASLTAALNVKVALKIKASLSLIVKGIFQKKCLPCPPDKTKNKCPPGKGDKGKGKCPPAKGKKGSPAKDKCSPGKGKQKKGGAGKGPLKCPPCPPCPPGKDKAGGRRDRGGKDSRRRLPANRGRAGGLMPEPKGPKLPKAPAGKSKGIIGMARAGIEAISGGGSAKGLGKFGKAAGKAAGTAAGFLGKVFKPVGLLTDAASILGAKPGEERNKAIRSAAGGWAGAAAGAATGAAIGSIIPGVGTAIGGLIGGALGGIGGSAIAENIGSIGKKVGGVGKKIGGWFGFGKKKKPAEDPAALPTPATPSQPQGPVGPPMAAAAAGSPGVLNVNLPAGAVQLIMQGLDLNYEELSALIGSKIADAIRRAMENKA